jgi:tRNA1Val (adenine37-N6)-methyltransferase
MKRSDMANPWFQFKQFSIRQDRSVFKVGTDGVLLGAWADVTEVRTALDVGTGTGLLAMMLAQRSEARITAIEIDGPSSQQARENAAASPWHERITILNTSLQDFRPEGRFDLVISNPPFFQDSKRPPDSGRAISRHDALLTLKDLAEAVPRLMHDKGKFCLVLPVPESRTFEQTGLDVGLHLHRETGIRPTPDRPVARRLMEFRLYPSASVRCDELVIEMGARHDYTERYIELTGDFYMAF